MRRKLSIVVAVVLATIAAGTVAWAEVSAETDVSGKYYRMIVLTNNSVKNLKIWAMQRSNSNVYPLNIYGDVNGDLYPTIAENPYDGQRPWVVWSRFDGRDYDLAWSRWSGGGWTPVAWVRSDPVAGDALAPRIGFDPHGRAQLTWWNDAGGGVVYFSRFLLTRWMDPLLVSVGEPDARNPSIEVVSDSETRIEYDTPEGRVERRILFFGPTTITDDIDPFSCFEVGSPSPVEGTAGSN